MICQATNTQGVLETASAKSDFTKAQIRAKPAPGENGRAKQNGQAATNENYHLERRS